MKELLEYIVKALVDKPQEVNVREIKSERTSVLELKVAADDMGKVVGKGGRIVEAIRTVLNASGAKLGRRVVLELID